MRKLLIVLVIIWLLLMLTIIARPAHAQGPATPTPSAAVISAKETQTAADAQANSAAGNANIATQQLQSARQNWADATRYAADAKSSADKAAQAVQAARIDQALQYAADAASSAQHSAESAAAGLENYKAAITYVTQLANDNTSLRSQLSDAKVQIATLKGNIETANQQTVNAQTIGEQARHDNVSSNFISFLGGALAVIVVVAGLVAWSIFEQRGQTEPAEANTSTTVPAMIVQLPRSEASQTTISNEAVGQDATR